MVPDPVKPPGPALRLLPLALVAALLAVAVVVTLSLVRDDTPRMALATD